MCVFVSGTLNETFWCGRAGREAHLRDERITGLGVQRERLECRIQVTWDFAYREKDRFVRVHRWVRWVKLLHVIYRGGCARGVGRDDMRVCTGKPGRRRDEKGKRDINCGPRIKTALNWAHIASQYRYDTSVPVVFSTSVPLDSAAIAQVRDCAG